MLLRVLSCFDFDVADDAGDNSDDKGVVQFDDAIMAALVMVVYGDEQRQRLKHKDRDDQGWLSW